MVEGIKGTRAYDFEGNEVNTFSDANILFIETEEAAAKIRDKNIVNLDYPFYEPGVYVTNEEYSYYWCSLDEYIDNMKKSINYYNSILTIIKEKEGN